MGILLDFQSNLDWLSKQSEDVVSFFHGIEKEGLRTEASGKIADNSHPQALGSTLTHPSITTDYSESLLEFITPVFKKPKDAIEHLTQLHQFSYQHLGEQTIWPASMPNFVPNELAINIAQYGSSNIGQLKTAYRHGLWHRYGRMMQAIAGLHFNFSFSDDFWKAFSEHKGNTEDMQSFISRQYFHLIRGFRRHSWLLLYLFGASPALDKSFKTGEQVKLETLSEDTDFLPMATSLRMSDIGYSNNAQSSLNICYNTLENYTASLSKAIKTIYPKYQKIGLKDGDQAKQLNENILQIENEYYSDIRPKRVANSGEKPIAALRDRGVQYIEVRCLDLNPFMPCGIDESQMKFLDVFLTYCLLSEQDKIDDIECEEVAENTKRVTQRGRDQNLTLLIDNVETPLIKQAETIFKSLNDIADVVENFETGTKEAIQQQFKKVHDNKYTPSYLLLKHISAHQGSFLKAGQSLANEHKAYFQKLDLPEVTQKAFNQLSEQSIIDQKEIESTDNVSFDVFLKEYLNG
ncbi:glutamate--cysteine ligase [Marinicellulosiphila megalodicopiae]|uniref:glutamate--cysteine ligase n=1 Tax=Marinicellulosiphila megalodicopiae TaxID=2724896 RepID=UPI003BAE87C4